MRALIIVDVQNDFCAGGSLPVPGGAEVAAGISAALDNPMGGNWDYVVATKDYHVDPGSHFGDPPDFARSWPAHCVVGTRGADFHPALHTARVEAVFTKGRYAAAYSGFDGGSSEGTKLADWLHAHDVTAVDVVGIATDHCVRATALDAVREGFDTSVLLHLTAGVDQSTVDQALTDLAEAGVTVVT